MNELSVRQKQIIKIVEQNQPVSSKDIAKKLGLSKSTIRNDLTFLTHASFLSAKPKVGYKLQPSIRSNIQVQQRLHKPVSTIMSIPAIVHHDDSTLEAITKIFLEDVGSLYVTEDSQLVGVISRKDLLKLTWGNNDVSQIPVSMVMSRMPNIVFIGKADSIKEALHLLYTHEFDSLPVVENKKGKLAVVGRFSKTNALRLLIEFSK